MQRLHSAFTFLLFAFVVPGVGLASASTGSTAVREPGIDVVCAGRDDTATLSAAIATAGDKAIIIAAGQTCTVSTIKIPNLQIEPGGLLKPATSHTVVITGSFRAGPYQTFTNALPGQGTISFAGNATINEVFTEWWGARPDGASDSTPAFNAAMASLTNNKPGVNGATIRLLAGDYRTTGLTITDQQVHLVGSGGPGVLGSTATSTTFISSVSNAPIIKYPASKEVYSMRARLESLTVIGSTTAGSNQVGVWVDNNGILMNNVGIEKTGSHGLYLTSSSVGGYSNLEINTTRGDGIRIDFTQSATPGAGTHHNVFHRISIGGTTGDGVRIMHGFGNLFYGLNLENIVGDGKGAGAGIHVYYPGDGKVEPQNNVFHGVWNENNVVGDFIGSGAQNNYVSYVHYASPMPKITGNNSYRNAAELNVPAVDRASYLLLGASETPVNLLLPTPPAPKVTVAAGSGLRGTYTYKITFETDVGETNGGTTSSAVNPANQGVRLTAIPIGPAGTVRRNIYRTTAGGPDNTQKFVATLSDNTTTVFDDRVPDQSLGRGVPLYNGSASRIVLDGDGNLAKLATSAQTALIGPQISDPKWPSYGFLSRPGFGMYMDSSNELSFVASPESNPTRKLRLLSTGVTDAIGGFTVGSGSTISKYLSDTASLDFAAWQGNDCQEKTMTLTGALDGDSVVLGIPNSLASAAGVMWTAWVSSANNITVRGCKITGGNSVDPPPATVRVSLIKH